MSNDLLQNLLGETVNTTGELPADHEHPNDFTKENGGLKDGALGEDANTDDDDADLGDLDPLDEEALVKFAESLNAYEEQTAGLSEQLNIVRLNRQTKLLNLSNRTAIMLARRANDPLFAKFNKFNSLRLKFRAAIVKKYGSRASSYARKIMSKASTANGPKK